MHRYCFALTSPLSTECHLRVGEFPNPEKAFQLAELIALELGIEADSQWAGWNVEVRSLQGERLFATAVGGEPVPQAMRA